MKINRRNFIALTGTAAAAGVVARYSPSLVASAPAKEGGIRWGMAIDLKRFAEDRSLAKKVIEACHVTHNVPTIDNPQHEVKWMWEEPYHHAFIEQENHRLPESWHEMPVTLLCNHCDNPPCTNVCPTQATWRREDGIVMMDWHRCVGCRYCMAACPYGSRSFNWFDPRPHLENTTSDFPTRCKGVVEKCTFCAAHIKIQMENGEEPCPHCVAAVKGSKAMFFGNLDDPNSEIRKILSERFSIRRKPALGTQPEVYYLL